MIPGFKSLMTIGRGAGSTIHKVQDRQTGEIFALKEVKRHLDKEGKFTEQVRSEYQVGHVIAHPNVRHVHKLYRVRRRLRVTATYLLMEYLEGHTLDRAERTDLNFLVDVFIRVARGLQAIHQGGFVHADTKPNNIMICADGAVKVFDLGQSCKLGSVKPRIQGTPDFIAPEQVMRLPLSERTDVFNLGTTMYWCLTRKTFPTRLRRPQKAGSFDIGTTSNVETPQQCNADVPTVLSNLVMDCCRNSPANRPADMDELLQKLKLVEHATQITRK